MSEHKNQFNTAPPSYEDLKRLYVTEGLSCIDTGVALGLSSAAIHRWLRRYGLNRSIKEGRKAAIGKTVYSPEGLAAKQANAAAMRARLTPESRRRQAEKMKGREPPNKGKRASEETKEKFRVLRADPEYRRRMSEANRGEKSPHWKGGQKAEHNRRLDTAEWRRIRQQVYARDNWTCQDCGGKCWNTRDSKRDGRKKIQAHHIIARRDGGTDDLANLVTLCMSCHHRRERLDQTAPGE